MNTIRDAIVAGTYLRDFINPSQLSVMKDGCRGEEGQFFIDKMVEMAHLIKHMPKTYEQDGKGDDAIVSLHYFKDNMDWHITEKDMMGEVDGQHQAFGLANLGHGDQLGYISITNLLENGVELDLYFEPRLLREVRK